MAVSPGIKLFVLFLLTGLLAGCGSKSFKSTEALWAHLNKPENGYQFEKKIKGVDYVLTYKPTDLLVKQELGNNYTREELNKSRQKYGEYLYFNLSMDVDGQELLNHKVSDRAAFGKAVREMAFGMGSRIHLIGKSRDTLPMLDYIYPRMYGMGKSTSMMLVYERNDKILNQDYFLLTIEDLGFSTGEVGFKIPAKPIRTEPILDL
jgi:hypothetical protein